MNTTEIVISGVGVTPLIVGLVELSKAYFPTKYAPLASLLLGIMAGIAAQTTLSQPVWMNGVIEGITVGLAASGLYSGIGKYISANADAPATTTAPAAPPTA